MLKCAKYMKILNKKDCDMITRSLYLYSTYVDNKNRNDKDFQLAS